MKRTRSGIQRIVVRVTEQDKKAIAAKARCLGLPVSELMRRGAFAYRPDDADQELATLADAAKAAAERAGRAIEDALDFIDASNQRISTMESEGRHLPSPAKRERGRG